MSECLDAIVIAGPTASGKTGLAVKAAKMLGGPVINADSMQVYDKLSIITARPQADEMDGVEHLLFGHVSPDEAYSVARYLDDVGPVIAQIRKKGKTPVFAGGTGLYFKGLMEGLAPVAEIDDAIRRDLRNRSAEEPQSLYRELQDADPDGAELLKPGDTQRIVRALEVVLSTGKPLKWWQSKKSGEALLNPDRCLKILLLPDRESLREKIAQRFETMMEEGGLDEVSALLELGLSKELPAMRAIGVRQMARFLSGEISRQEGIELAVNASRQYAKRQYTWFRNQFLVSAASQDGRGLLAQWHEFAAPEAAFSLVETAIKRFVNHKV